MGYATESRTLRFLVVDDLGIGRTVLQGMLARFGEVETADSGPSALQLYRAAVAGGTPYDLALLDIMMPGMDGLSLLEELRGFEHAEGIPEMPVAMATALDDRKHVHAALEAGAGGYLIKPLSLAKVESLLERMGLV